MAEKREKERSSGVMLCQDPKILISLGPNGCLSLQLSSPLTLSLLCRWPAPYPAPTHTHCPALPQLWWAMWYNLFSNEKFLAASF